MEYSLEIRIVVTMLTVFSVVGGIGNSLVLWVVTSIPKGKQHTFFIRILACIDLLTCIITIPATITMEMINFRVPFTSICRIYHFLMNSTIPLSAFLMMSIAIERYFCICKNVKQHKLQSKSKIAVLCIILVSVLIGGVCCLNYGTLSFKKIPTRSELSPKSRNITCYSNTTSAKETCDNKVEIYQSDIVCGLSIEFGEAYYHITEKIYSLMFAIFGITVVCVYSRIYYFLLSHKTHVARNSIGGKLSDGYQTDHITRKQQKLRRICASSELSSMYREKRKRLNRKYVKVAGMFSIVAFVFISAFLPAWLMKLKAIDFNIYVFYLYFVYTVCNPFIYGFINPDFSTAIRKCICCVPLPSRPKF